MFGKYASYLIPRNNSGLSDKYLLVLVKMFYHMILDRKMQLHPCHLGARLHDKLVSKLVKEVEGTYSGCYGSVVAIMGIDHVSKGLISEGTEFVTFPIKYKCVVFRPFKGETLEAVVLIRRVSLLKLVQYRFLCNRLIPNDMEFRSADTPSYTTSDGSVKIQKNCEVRLKIVGTQADATKIFCIDTNIQSKVISWA